MKIYKIKKVFYAFKYRRQLKAIAKFFASSNTTSFGVEGFGLLSETHSTSFFFNIKKGFVTIYKGNERSLKSFEICKDGVYVEDFGFLQVPEPEKQDVPGDGKRRIKRERRVQNG
jgi:hypothetical protein